MNYQPKKLSQIYSKIRALDTLLLATTDQTNDCKFRKNLRVECFYQNNCKLLLSNTNLSPYCEKNVSKMSAVTKILSILPSTPTLTSSTTSMHFDSTSSMARVTSVQSSVNNIGYTVTLLLTRQRKNLVNGTFSYLIPGTSWQMESTCGV